MNFLLDKVLASKATTPKTDKHKMTVYIIYRYVDMFKEIEKNIKNDKPTLNNTDLSDNLI
jgi:hypothetical protein